MRTTALLLPLIIPGLSSALHAQQQRSADRPQAEPLSNTRWHRALSYHRDQLSVRRADLCFVGDSLTECWSQEGSAAWRELTRGWQAVNCGISGDRTEHILFRLDKINLAKARPRVVVLLMGTNNLSAEPPDSPDAVIGAITKAIDLMKKASPETQIVLLSLPPNGPTPNTPLQQRVSETNRLLATCATAKEVTFVDLHGAVALPDGRWKPGCTVDGTHLSAAGYALAIKVLIPALTPLLKPGSP